MGLKGISDAASKASRQRAGRNTAIRGARSAVYRSWATKMTKFGAKTATYQGQTYHSKMEASYASYLDLMRVATQDRHRVKTWRRQVPIKLEVNGMLVTTYIVDFEVLYFDGRIEFHEVKGFETPEWRIKEKLFRALNPGVPLIVVKLVNGRWKRAT